MVARYTRAEVESLRSDAEIATSGSIAQATAHIVKEGAPDYVLLDLMLPDSEGLAGLVELRRIAPNAVIGVITGETHPRVMRDCFTQGARGYLTKSTGADEFTSALRKFFENGFFYPPQAADTVPNRPVRRLTAREVEVLQALALGKLNKQLAPMLKISESTFKTYLRSIYDKLGVQTRVQAVQRGIELGLIRRQRIL